MKKTLTSAQAFDLFKAIRETLNHASERVIELPAEKDAKPVTRIVRESAKLSAKVRYNLSRSQAKIRDRVAAFEDTRNDMLKRGAEHLPADTEEKKAAIAVLEKEMKDLAAHPEEAELFMLTEQQYLDEIASLPLSDSTLEALLLLIE